MEIEEDDIPFAIADGCAELFGRSLADALDAFELLHKSGGCRGPYPFYFVEFGDHLSL